MAELTWYNKTSSRKLRSKPVKLSKKDIFAVTEHAPDIICRFDRECRLLYVNPAIELATGIPTHAFINKTTRELGMPEEHSANWEDKISFVVSTGEQTTLEFPFLTPANGLRFFHTVLVPEFTSDGVVDTILTVSRDITEKKELDKKKEETVSIVSHELKTPVTSLKLTTQVLKKKFDREGNDNITRQLEIMDKQIDKLTNIIGNLMDTTRIEKGSIGLKNEKFNFNDLIKEIVDDVQKTAKSHKIFIKGESRKAAIGDKFRIGQVITNLLTNAIRYSPGGEKIIVTISSDKDSITCGVQDFGIGIAKDQQKRIFERFYRVKDIDQAFYMGLGLGLYISSEIVKQHKGKIWVKSKPNVGSTFFFTLPVK